MTTFINKAFGAKLNFALMLAILAMACSMTYVLIHELTHLALADQADGFCIGNCAYNGEMAYGRAFGKHNETSTREDLPSATGIIITAIMALYGSKKSVDLYQFESEK